MTTNAKYEDALQAVSTYLRNEFGDNDMQNAIDYLPAPIGIAYTDIFNGDEFFCSMQVLLDIPHMEIMFVNETTGEVYDTDTFDNMDDLIDCMNSLTFQECYSEFLDRATAYTGLEELN